MNFLKQNWFKLGIFLIATMAVAFYGFKKINNQNEYDLDDKSSAEKQYNAYAVGDDNYPILVMPIDEGVTSTDLNGDNIKDVVLKNPKDDNSSSPRIYTFMVLEANGDREIVKIFNKSGKYETDIETIYSDNCIVRDVNLLDTLDMGKLLVLADRFPDSKTEGQIDFSFYKLSLENGVYVYSYRGHVASENKYCDVKKALEKELPLAFESARNLNIFEPTPLPTPRPKPQPLRIIKTSTPTPQIDPAVLIELCKSIAYSDADQEVKDNVNELMANSPDCYDGVNGRTCKRPTSDAIVMMFDKNDTYFKNTYNKHYTGCLAGY